MESNHAKLRPDRRVRKTDDCIYEILDIVGFHVVINNLEYDNVYLSTLYFYKSYSYIAQLYGK